MNAAARWLLLLCLITGPLSAHAQQNQCRTPPPGTSTSFCASEAFVTKSIVASVPYFSASLSANQTGIASATPTKVHANTILSNTNGWYDGVTNFRFTPLLAGKFAIRGFATFNGAGITEVDCFIYKNGAAYAQAFLESSALSAQGCSMNIIVSFNGTTDYVEFFGQVFGGGPFAIVGGAAPIFTWFEAVYAGP